MLLFSGFCFKNSRYNLLMDEIRNTRSHRFALLLGLELKGNFARLQVSQTRIADKLGHSRTSYSKWLNAKPSMPIEALLNTCELIGLDPREIVNAAYERLIEEMGPYVDKSQRESLIDRAVVDPESFGVAALRDENKSRESQGGEGR
ncbi:MAG: helix-turn-helix transcriptional regulator [Bifidobacterium mongoliense]|uniref:helix-turn-helix domain-containing protein n=2 Tax=Bifidobacterium mongoliense TaxID=518643 RepID=UPI002F34FA9D